MNIEDALIAYRGELIVAAERWRARRERRRRRLILVTSMLALAGVIVGTAVAATGWLVGAPAPRNVKEDFGSYAPQLGFNPEPGKAVLVARDGADKIYATPDKQGGLCLLLVTPSYHPGPQGSGGDCYPRQFAAKQFWGGPWGAPTPLRGGGVRVVVAGRTRNRAATAVRFTTPDGKTVTAPVASSGFFITSMTSSRPLFITIGVRNGLCRWTSTFTVLDKSRHQLLRKTLTFGPHLCLAPPKPVVTTRNGVRTITIQRGADGYLTHARPGDDVVCRSVHGLLITIPQGTPGRFRRSSDRKSSFNLKPTKDGRVWVLCE